MHSIADIRKDYKLKTLDETDAASDAIVQFTNWWNEANSSEIDEVNAMTLATTLKDGSPDARIVLLKGYNEKGFSFFTNYQSAKGRELEENPKACLVFFWKELERQIKIVGTVTKVTSEASTAYFDSRPPDSRVGAHVSPQSEIIPNREWLDNRLAELQKQYEGKKVDRPAHWGGYIVKPALIEFWQGRPDRLHDRLQYTLNKDGSWKLERIAP
jgi:pyridoxamine 5'-phosphate oxidase